MIFRNLLLGTAVLATPAFADETASGRSGQSYDTIALRSQISF